MKTPRQDPESNRLPKGVQYEVELAAIEARLGAIVDEAGALALEFFRPGAPTSAKVMHKAGGSPVTEADLALDRLLKEKLRPLAPHFGWLSEETTDSADRLGKDALFTVDPIDGTRGFARGDPCWAICAACVVRGRPVLAIVHAPALGQTYTARLGAGARMNGVAITVSSQANLAQARLAAPEPLLADLRHAGAQFQTRPKLPSLAMRLIGVAAGELEGALANPNAYDWDIAAADLILHEAGGLLTDLEGKTPVYNSPSTLHGPLIAAPAALHAQLLAAARQGAEAGAQLAGNKAPRRQSKPPQKH